ncbi:MAG: hypothetical protein M3R00_06400 [Pseudomonadota bacterium]|nr:hypothetical protein [Pseudomonadota bacterium]
MQEALDFAQLRKMLVIQALVHYRLVPALNWEDENTPHRQIYFTMIEPLLPLEPYKGLEGKDPRIALLKILAAARKARVPGDEASVYTFCAKILKMDPHTLMPEILHGMETLKMRCAYIMTHAPFWIQPGLYPQTPVDVAGEIAVKQHQYVVPNKHYDYHDALASNVWTSAAMCACKFIERTHDYDDSVDHRCHLLLLARYVENTTVVSQLDKARIFLSQMSIDRIRPHLEFCKLPSYGESAENQPKDKLNVNEHEAKCYIQ